MRKRRILMKGLLYYIAGLVGYVIGTAFIAYELDMSFVETAKEATMILPLTLSIFFAVFSIIVFLRKDI